MTDQQPLLITGSSGFIGSKVCEMLLEAGERVVGIDNMNDYYDVRLKEYRLNQLLKYPGFKFYHADIENLNELRLIFSDFQFRTVFNLAARAGIRYSIVNPWVYFKTNVEGTLNLLEIIKDFGIKKFVMASSSSIYSGLPTPFSEDQVTSKPISPYAASKLAAESIAYTYHHHYGLDISVLRYFSVFGPGGRPDMAPYRFVKSILAGVPLQVYGDGSQSRDFTYIDDIARGTILAEKSLGYEVINLGSGHQPVRIDQLIKWIEELTGIEAKIEYLSGNSLDLIETQASIEKARFILGWQPIISTYEGLRKMIELSDLLRFSF